MKAGKVDRLQKKLLQEGIAYGHVRRCIRELEDHYDDLFVQARSKGLSDKTAACLAEQELGDLDALAVEMGQRNELKSVGSRFPKTTFLLMPFLSYIFIVIATLMLCIALMDTMFPSELAADQPPPDWVVLVVEYVRLFFMHMLAPLLSCWYLSYGLRQQIASKLLYSGVVLVNLFSSALLLNVSWPDPENGITQGSIGASIGYGFYNVRGVTDTKVRFLATIAVLIVFVYVYRRRLFGNKPGW